MLIGDEEKPSEIIRVIRDEFNRREDKADEWRQGIDKKIDDLSIVMGKVEMTSHIPGGASCPNTAKIETLATKVSELPVTMSNKKTVGIIGAMTAAIVSLTEVILKILKL